MKETIEVAAEADVEVQEKVAEEEEDVPVENKTSNEEPEVVLEEVKNKPEVEARKDTIPATEKEVPKPTVKSSVVEEIETKMGNWFNKEIRSRIQTTPKGWELRGAG